MRRALLFAALPALLLTVQAKAHPLRSVPAPGSAVNGDRLVALPPSWGAVQADISNPELTAAGRNARGVFISPLALRRRGLANVISTLRGARMTAVVTDVKGERGEILYDSSDPSLAAARDPVLEDLGGFIRALRGAGVYTIARIVCFKDPRLAAARPDLAARDARTGRTWHGRNGARWVTPYAPEVQDRLIRVALDAERLGFDELQLDYVRFPVEEEAQHAVFPQAYATLRRFVIGRFLERMDAALGIPLSVAVYGLTPFNVGDRAGLGQSIEDLAHHVEVLSPMLYSSSFDETFVPTPSFGHRVAAIVRSAVGGLKRRVGNRVAIRPYLQAFPRREPEFGISYVYAQDRAARQAGADGILFWNPRSEYRAVYEALRLMGRVNP